MDAWIAADHEFGKGKVHWIKDKPDGSWDAYDPARRIKLLCGKWLEAVPGRRVIAAMDEQVTCGGCRQKKITLDEAPHQAEMREQQQAQWREHREQEQVRWHAARMAELRERYARPDWQELRDQVLQRDSFLCQGCRRNRATAVHHLTYDRLGREVLFDLISVCTHCHERIHPHLEASNGTRVSTPNRR